MQARPRSFSLIHMKTWYTLKLFYHLVRLAARPQNTTTALKITECLYKLGLLKDEADHVASFPECRHIIEKRKLLTIPELKTLNRYPPDTVARVYSDHMLKEGLSPEFFKVLDITDDETFVMMRLRQSHDLWHILTGFDTTVPDELGLLAFMMAQVRSPFSPIIIAGGLLSAALKRPHEAPLIMERITHGWRMGIKAKPAFAIDWQANWKTPLSELRAQILGADPA